MTEDEAKTKACCGPPGLVAGVLMAASRKVEPAPGTELGCCVGAACMAWNQGQHENSGHCGLTHRDIWA